MPAVMKVADAGKVLGVHPNTVRTWIRSGRIRGFAVGKQVRPVKEDVDRLLTNGTGVTVEPSAIAEELIERARLLEVEAERLRDVAAELRSA